MMSNEEYKHFSAEDWEIIYKAVMHEYGRELHARDKNYKIKDPETRKARRRENCKRLDELKKVWYKAHTQYMKAWYESWE